MAEPDDDIDDDIELDGADVDGDSGDNSGANSGDDYNGDSGSSGSPGSSGSSGSSKRSKKISTKSMISKNNSGHKFKFILIFRDFFTKLQQNKNRLIYDINDNTGNIVYGITANQEIIPILKLIILKKELLEKKLLKKKSDEEIDKKTPNLFFMFFIEDSSGSNKYKMNEINFFQGQQQDPQGFIPSKKYNYEVYHNFKGDNFSGPLESYLVVKEKIPFSNNFKILHIFYNFDLAKYKVKYIDVFVKDDNTLNNSTGTITSQASQTSQANSSQSIQPLQIKGQIEKSFGKGVTAIQLDKKKDPFEIGRCIEDGNNQKYRINQIFLDTNRPLEKNSITLDKISPYTGLRSAPLISELQNYTHIRCTDDDTGCMSFRFKDGMIPDKCSKKNPYELKIDDVSLKDILSKKNNKSCEKDAEILKKKCEIINKSKK